MSDRELVSLTVVVIKKHVFFCKILKTKQQTWISTQSDGYKEVDEVGFRQQRELDHPANGEKARIFFELLYPPLRNTFTGKMF